LLVFLLTVPIAILFLGIVADPDENNAVWYGMLNAIGKVDVTLLNDAEKANYLLKKHYFWFGEVGMGSNLAATFAILSTHPQNMSKKSKTFDAS